MKYGPYIINLFYDVKLIGPLFYTLLFGVSYETAGYNKKRFRKLIMGNTIRKEHVAKETSYVSCNTLRKVG